jgi:hypothetical protein
VHHRIEPPSWDSVTYSQLMDSWDRLSLNSDIASKTEGSITLNQIQTTKVVTMASWLNLDYHGLTWLNMVFHSVE